MAVDGAALVYLRFVVVFELDDDDASGRVLAINVDVGVVAGVEAESCDCIGLGVALVIGIEVNVVVDVAVSVDEVDVVFLVNTVVSGMVVGMPVGSVAFIVVL